MSDHIGRALVAWNLRKLRTERSISQEKLAADTGVDRAYVGELERGRGNATVDLLERLAQVLGVPLGEFFVEPEASSLPPPALPSGRRARAG
ncbi:helix-turn-helix transcriptional regulator [Brevundimonas sp. 2R-24]|uniref:Helix-turn-helix transcriptional regulator n=1 Tax=Peiella sedimenti TaxID=3061083 RepID=A0ABT8SLV1_9CAUL|nr:helix-turn-helix transcriptional regulator [Caulobacteraceae bacterium XZ-24]